MMSDPSDKHLPQRPTSGLLESRLGSVLAKLPPFSWIIRWSAYALTRGQMRGGELVLQDREPSADLASALQAITYDIVTTLGYAAAMVATYERDDSLPVRAIYVDPTLITPERIEEIETTLAADHAAGPLSLTDPQIARVYVNRPDCRGNLSVQAAHTHLPVTSDQLYDLFTPVVPEAARPAVDGIQEALHIRQVVAVPFFIETSAGGEMHREYVGNLFAAKGEVISQDAINLLRAFARQTGAAILSERRRMRAEIIQRLILDIQHRLDSEAAILERITRCLVQDLDYAAALITPLEAGGALPLRAVYIDPEMVSPEQVAHWEDEINLLVDGDPISLGDSAAARVHLHDEAYRDNLGVRAARAGKPLVSESLYDLLRPILPEGALPALEGIQKALAIHQVIAVPFFLGTGQRSEFFGTLFAVTRSPIFQPWEIELLRLFGQQAAAGLRNARLYRRSEDRRVAAQIFGKMAFSATAALHAFRNHIGVLRLNVGLFANRERADALLDDPESRTELLDETMPAMEERLDQITELLDNLHEPFRQAPDLPVDINACLLDAAGRLEAPEGWLCLTLADNLSPIYTMPEMLTEAFRVLLKNALEAVQALPAPPQAWDGETKGDCPIVVISRLRPPGQIEVSVYDRGVGILPENLASVFELGATSKRAGMGFGLFWTRDYIQGLGGDIEIQSQPDHGAHVRILLPIDN